MEDLYKRGRKIASIIAIAFILDAVAACNSSNKMHAGGKNSGTLQDSVLVDSDGNRYRIKRFLDGNMWMIDNLKLNSQGSYCYANRNDSCERYGRLYLWESAKQGCTSLGESWHLPSKDEWQTLALVYGPAAKDSIESMRRAFHPLLYSGHSQFNALLGGGRQNDGKYARAEAHGFYWTATETDSSTAWFANFAKGSQFLYHQKDGEKTSAFSVRCMKRITTLK
jgi:uncharacterized protein (TIGR02145 family)